MEKERYAGFGERPRGYRPAMMDPRLDDHLGGLEQELVELVERRTRALVQGRDDDATALADEIDAVQAELVAIAEKVATETPQPPARVTVDPPVAMTDGVDSPPSSARRGRRPWLRRAPLRHA